MLLRLFPSDDCMGQVVTFSCKIVLAGCLMGSAAVHGHEAFPLSIVFGVSFVWMLFKVKF